MNSQNNPLTSKKSDHLNILVHNSKEDSKSIDLLTLLYKKGLLIFCIATLGTVLAIAFTKNLKPTYTASTRLVEHSTSQFEDLYISTGINITPSELLSIFLKKLSNTQNFKSFIKENEPLINKIYSNAAINQQKKIDQFDINKLESKVTIRQDQGLLREGLANKITDDGFEGVLNISSPKIDANASLNNAYIQYTNNMILNEIVKKQQDIVHLEINKLQQQIGFLKEVDTNRLSFEIAKLKAQIANVETKNNKKLLSRLQSKLFTNQYDLQLLSSTNQSSNKDLLTKQAQLQNLKNLSFATSKIKSYMIDGDSSVLKTTPNKNQIIFLGAFIGLIFGTIISMFQISLRVRKELEASISENIPNQNQVVYS